MFARRTASEQSDKYVRREKLSHDNCANRSEWRVAPGKAPERLASHYQLNCDFGTALIDVWKRDGTEPIYICDGHIQEFSSGRVTTAGNRREAREIVVDDSETKADPKPNSGAKPTFDPKTDCSADAKIPDPADRGKAARAAKHAADRRPEVNRLIGEQIATLEAALAQSDARISVGTTIDAPLEKAALEIIDAEMPDAQKDSVISHLQELQKTLKAKLNSDGKDGMAPREAYEIKKTVAELLKGTDVQEEAKAAYRSLYATLETAIHSALPKSKHYEDRLEKLLEIRAGLEPAAISEK